MKLALLNIAQMTFLKSESENKWVNDYTDALLIESNENQIHGSFKNDDLNLVFIDPSKIQSSSSEELLDLLVDGINGLFDGNKIAEAMTDITGCDYTYTEDSVWSVGGRSMDGDNLIETIVETEISTKELIRLCNAHCEYAAWKSNTLDTIYICPLF